MDSKKLANLKGQAQKVIETEMERGLNAPFYLSASEVLSLTSELEKLRKDYILCNKVAWYMLEEAKKLEAERDKEHISWARASLGALPSAAYMRGK